MGEYCERKEDFDGNVKRHDALYQEIAAALQKGGVPVSGKECKERHAALKDKFRKEYDKTAETGAAPSAWPLFDLFLEIEGRNAANLKAPITVSAGTKSIVERAESVMNSIRSGKSRPPTSSRQQKLVERVVGNRKPIGQRERSLSLQERKIALEESFLKEFSAFRQESAARSEVIRKGLEVLKEIQNKNVNK